MKNFYKNNTISGYGLMALVVILILIKPLNMNAQQVLVGTGTGTNSGSSGPPLTRNYAYSASEQLYLGSAINTSGQIAEIGFYKSSGSDVNPIENVSIYLKSTTATTVGTTATTSDYTLVYSGAFTNNITAGWVSVPLQVPFTFNHSTGNLSVLIVKGLQTSLSSGFPVYRNIGGSSDNTASYYRSDNTAWSSTSSMTRSSIIKPQLRLVFTPCTTRPTITNVSASSTSASLDYSCIGCTGNFFVEYGLSGFNPGSKSAAGGGTIISGNASPIPISSLNQGVSYDVYLRNNCSDSSFSINSVKYTFTTTCDTYTLPYTQNFDATTSPSLPPCTNVSNENNDAYQWQTSSSYRNTTPNSLYLYTGSNIASNDWFFTPAFYFEAGKTYRFTFRYRTGAGSSSFENFKIALGAYASSSAMTSTIADYNNVRASSYTSDTIYFTPSTNGINYVGIHSYSAAAKEFISIDDITLALSPVTCLPPKTLTVLPLTDTSANFSWTAPLATLPQGYVWEIRSSGVGGSGATGRAATGTTSSNVLNATTTLLSSATTYTLYVRTDCSSNGFSSWASSATFTTPCSAATTPYSEDFSSTSGTALPNCTSTQARSGAGTWTTNNVSGRVLQYLRTYSQYANGYFFTKGVKLSAGKAYRIKFDYRGTSSSGSSINLNLKVLAGTWSDSLFQTSGELFSGAVPVNASFVQGSGVFTPTQSGTYYFSFYVYSETAPSNLQNYLYVDNILLEEYPVCIHPISQAGNLVLTPNYTTVSGSFNGASPSADQYLVIRTNTNTPPSPPADGVEYTVGSNQLGGYIEHNGSGLSFTSNRLDIGTTYFYWIYAFNSSSCSGGPLYNTTSPLNASVSTLSCNSYGTKTYTNTTTNQNINVNWSSINWSPTGVPGPCDNVVITNQNTSTNSWALNVTLDTEVNINGLEVKAEYGSTVNNKPIEIRGHSTLPLIINNDFKISGNAGSGSAAEIRFLSNGGALIVKGNTTLGLPTDNVNIAFGQNAGNPRFEFRGNITFNALSYVRNNGLGSWVFDSKSSQTLSNNSISTKATPPVSFFGVNVGDVNAPDLTLSGNSNVYLRGGDLIINKGAVLSLPEGQTLYPYTSNTGAFALLNGGTIKLGGILDGISSGNNFPKNFALVLLDNGSTVEYNGSLPQTIAPWDYSNLKINNNANVSLPSNVKVNGQLTFDKGKLLTGNDTLLLTAGAAISGAGANKYVEGFLANEIETGSTLKIFEIGNANGYAPISFSFFNPSISNGRLTVKAKEGQAPDLINSGLSNAKYIDNYWDVKSSGISQNDSLKVSINFKPEDVIGGADLNLLSGAILRNGNWSIYPTLNSPSTFQSEWNIKPPLEGTYVLAERIPDCILSTDESSAASYALASNTAPFSSCEVNDNTWHYLKNSENKILLAINSRGQDLGKITAEIQLDAQNGPFTDNTCSGNNSEYYVGRVVKIRTEKTPSDSIFFRLFFTDAEYQSFKNKVANQDENYQRCYGISNNFNDLIISAFFTGNVDGEPITQIVKSQNGPQGAYQFEMALSPALNGERQASSGRFDQNGTTFYIHGSGGTGSTLPVELTNFNGDYQFGTIVLEWATASEKNNDRFEVLRSFDGINFTKIGEVAGNGTSVVPQQYDFKDASIKPDFVYYYQLRQIDFDGSQNLSKIIAVSTGDTYSTYAGDFFPNPANSATGIILNVSDTLSPISIQIFSTDGRLILNKLYSLHKGVHKIEIDTRNIPNGSYLGIVKTGDNTFKRLMIIQH